MNTRSRGRRLRAAIVLTAVLGATGAPGAGGNAAGNALRQTESSTYVGVAGSIAIHEPSTTTHMMNLILASVALQPGPFGSTSDPTCAGAGGGGASIATFNPTTGESDYWMMPCLQWVASGTGYAYRDPSRSRGPVTDAAITPGSLTLQAVSPGISYTLDEQAQGSIQTVVAIGGGPSANSYFTPFAQPSIDRPGSFVQPFAPATGVVAPRPPSLTYPVYCAGQLVGYVDAGVSPNGRGVNAGFTPSGSLTLDQVEALCGEDHLNWFQVVTFDNHPPRDANGNRLSAPYCDPPPGGYSNQWADRLPWYWDEGADPPAGTPGFDDGYNIDDHTGTNPNNHKEYVQFEDFPAGQAGTVLWFRTSLASLNADGTIHSWHGGFSWDWTNSGGAPKASNIIQQGEHP